VSCNITVSNNSIDLGALFANTSIQTTKLIAITNHGNSTAYIHLREQVDIYRALLRSYEHHIRKYYRGSLGKRRIYSTYQVTESYR